MSKTNKKSSVNKQRTNEIINFYDLTKHLNKKYYNPNFAYHGIKIPARILICGGSGSYKTGTLMNIISRMSNTFNRIIVCCKSKEEPLYEYLEEKAGDLVEFFEGIGSIPSCSQFKDSADQILVVFDDLCVDKNQKIIEDYFIRSRKIANGITCIYLTQSYYKTPKIIRLQCNYIILKKLSSMRDLKLILSENSMDIDLKRLIEIYKYCTRDQKDFMMLDLDATDDPLNNVSKIRHNFLEYIASQDANV
jgi:hypothetical protein